MPYLLNTAVVDIAVDDKMIPVNLHCRDIIALNRATGNAAWTLNTMLYHAKPWPHVRVTSWELEMQQPMDQHDLKVVRIRIAAGYCDNRSKTSMHVVSQSSGPTSWDPNEQLESLSLFTARDTLVVKAIDPFSSVGIVQHHTCPWALLCKNFSSISSRTTSIPAWLTIIDPILYEPQKDKPILERKVVHQLGKAFVPIVSQPWVVAKGTTSNFLFANSGKHGATCPLLIDWTQVTFRSQIRVTTLEFEPLQRKWRKDPNAKDLGSSMQPTLSGNIMKSLDGYSMEGAVLTGAGARFERSLRDLGLKNLNGETKLAVEWNWGQSAQAWLDSQ